MTGTRAGGRKAAKTLKARYGKNYFHINGAKGGNPILLKEDIVKWLSQPKLNPT